MSLEGDRPPTIRFGPTGHLATKLAAIVVVALLLSLRFGLLQSLEIDSVNMAPTLAPEDRVLVRGYGVEPERGEVVVYRSPFDPSVLQVGRVVAMPGESVELNERGLFVDGESVSPPEAGCADAEPETAAASAGASSDEAEGSACELPGAHDEEASTIAAEQLGGHRYFTRQAGHLTALHFLPRKVAEGHVFVLNDNRVDERDSRIYGAIPASAVVGVAAFVYYASDETGIRWDRMTRRLS